MKVIAVFAAVMAVSAASPQFLGYNGLGYGYGLGQGLTYAAAPAVVAAPIPVATKTQYHAQDELGQASFGHSEPGQAHAAVRDAAGGVRGTFSYISPEGIPFTTHYVADHNGYRVASNALPVAPSVAIHGPVDTPEVQVAKAQHAAAHVEAAARAGRKKRGVVAPAAFGYGYSAVAAPAAFGYGYSTAAVAPAVSYAAAVPATHVVSSPAVTYAAQAAPAVTYAAAPAAFGYGYSAVAPAVGVSHLGYSGAVGVSHLGYSGAVVSHPAVRAATLTKVVNTPGHAVSYRVD